MNINIFSKYKGKVIDSTTGLSIEGVCVTDGRHIVKTNANGEFVLKGYYNSHFIYITVPSGYSCNNFYIPLDKKQSSYDFYLTKNECSKNGKYSFIHISDTEIGKRENYDWLENLKEYIKSNKPAFLIHTGDICYEYGLKKHIEVMNSENMGCDIHYVIGNHDFLKGKNGGERLYESLYGPTWYSFEIGNIHYIVTPIRFGLDSPSKYWINDSLIWLKNDLDNTDKSKKVIVFNHTKCENDEYEFLKGKKRLDLKECNLIGWFFGHYHYNIIYKNKGILNVSAPRPNGGGIDSSPAGFRVVSIGNNDSLSTKTKYYLNDINKEPIDTLWKTKLKGNILFTDTIYENSKVYTASCCDDYPTDCGVYSIDSENGNINWYYKTINSVKNNLAINQASIFAMDCEGIVYCINKNDGKLNWKKELMFMHKSLGTSNAICLNKDILIVGNSADIYAINIQNGKGLWHKQYKSGESSPSEFVVYENKVFVSNHWGFLSCLDINSGQELWKNCDGKIRFRSSAPAIYDKDTLIIAGDDTLMLVNIDDGKIVYKEKIDGYIFSSSGTIEYNQSVAYIPTINKGLLAYDVKQKQILWSFETKDNTLLSAPYSVKGYKTVECISKVDDDKIIFGANDGYVYIIGKDGKLISKYNAGSSIMGKIAVADNKLYTATFNGYICCYEI